MYYVIISRMPNSAFGAVFNKIRVRYMSRMLRADMGDRAFFERNVYIGHLKNIQFGINCHINENVYLQSCSLGDNVLLAPGVKILANVHSYDNIALPIALQQGSKRPVIIGDNVWLGTNVLVLPGVEIGDNVIVGAGSVVTKNLSSNCIYAGVPAKFIKQRI